MTQQASSAAQGGHSIDQGISVFYLSETQAPPAPEQEPSLPSETGGSKGNTHLAPSLTATLVPITGQEEVNLIDEETIEEALEPHELPSQPLEDSLQKRKKKKRPPYSPEPEKEETLTEKPYHNPQLLGKLAQRALHSNLKMH